MPALIAAPAIVRAASLMPVKSWLSIGHDTLFLQRPFGGRLTATEVAELQRRWDALFVDRVAWQREWAEIAAYLMPSVRPA